MRAARLVKPGGWLLIEENDIAILEATGGPQISRVASIYGEHLRAYGADPGIAAKLEGLLYSLRMFSEVHVKHLAIPMCRTNEGELLWSRTHRFLRVNCLA